MRTKQIEMTRWAWGGKIVARRTNSSEAKKFGACNYSQFGGLPWNGKKFKKKV